MDRRSNRGQIILRYSLVSLLISGLAALVVYHAVDTTVVHAQDWNHKADSLMSRVYYVQPLRGDILADDGTVLATNVTAYDISMDYRASAKQQAQFVECLDSLCDSLAHYYPVRSKDAWRQYLAAPLKDKESERTTYRLILKGASDADYQRLLSFPYFNRWKSRYMHGLRSNPREVRMMPYGAMAHRSIGRCNLDTTPKFVGASRACDTISRLRGYSGLEAALDSLLTGQRGLAHMVPLTHGVSNWIDVPAQDGLTLRTTININMQDIVENELQAVLQETGADWGTCILMHVPTGDIKAISNLEKDQDDPGKYIEAMNYALRGVEPGSVMKPISMIIALEDGYALPLTKTYDIGYSYAYAGGSPIHDTHSPASLPVSRFIEYSSNIGMTKLLAPHYAKDLNGFRERLRDIGFLDPLNTGMAGERPPEFPTLDPKAGGHISLSRMTYGYSSKIPPLYTCAIYNAIANKGKFVRPRMVSEYISRDGVATPVAVSYVRDSVCSQANAQHIMDMLHSVVYGEGGTAKSLRNDIVTIVGKTGTCRIANEAWRDKDGQWHKPGPGYKDNQLRLAFCGVFPYEDPQYTCMVLISNPAPQFRSAAMTSGKVLQNVAYKMYSHGMLGNYSDYTAIANRGTTPVVYASDNDAAAAMVKQASGASSLKMLQAPGATGQGEVPDVAGLGIRDAIARIEDAGFTIEASGIGYAVSQTPAAGTPAVQGDRVSVRFATR